MTSTLRTVGTGIAWNTVASFAVKGLALANVFIILRHLSVYDYGIVQLVLTVVSTVGGLLLPGLSTVLISDLARDRGAGNTTNATALARQYFFLQLVLGLVAFLVLFVGSSFFATYLHHETLAFYLRISSFSFLVGTVRGLFSVLATVELRFAFQSVLSILDEGVKFLLLLVFFWFEMGAAGVLYTMVLAPLVVVLVTLPWGISSIKPLFSAGPAEEPWWKLVRGHRLWGVSSSYLTTLNQNVRLWLIQVLLGTEAVGLFSFAQGLVSQAIGFVTFSAIAAPVIAQATHIPKRLADFANRALKYQLWIAIAALIPGAIITPFFISLVFPVYVGATTMTMIGLVMIIPAAVNVPVAAVYAALKQQRQFFMRATLVKTVIMVSILPPLLFTVGLTGAMIEIVITNIFSVVERTRSLRHSVPGFISSVRPFFVFDRSDAEILHRVGGPFRQLFARVTLTNDEAAR